MLSIKSNYYSSLWLWMTVPSNRLIYTFLIEYSKLRDSKKLEVLAVKSHGGSIPPPRTLKALVTPGLFLFDPFQRLDAYLSPFLDGLDAVRKESTETRVVPASSVQQAILHFPPSFPAVGQMHARNVVLARIARSDSHDVRSRGAPTPHPPHHPRSLPNRARG
jgi:hypothetical protein